MHRETDLGWHVARAATTAAIAPMLRLRFAGLSNVPRSDGALVTYNHISVLDAVVVALGVAHRGRAIRFLALSELFEGGAVAWILRKTHQIPLRRGFGDWGAIETVADVIREGSLAGMAPEGRIGDATALQPGQRGAARIALAAEAPVVPVGVWGTHLRWPQEGLRLGLPLRPAVGVAFGKPISPQGRARSRPDTIAHLERIMAGLSVAVDRARTLAAP
jgi:1-acyl-sn-glycerol-3-phosphate acyltransferase